MNDKELEQKVYNEFGAWLDIDTCKKVIKTVREHDLKEIEKNKKRTKVDCAKCGCWDIDFVELDDIRKIFKDK